MVSSWKWLRSLVLMFLVSCNQNPPVASVEAYIGASFAQVNYTDFTVSKTNSNLAIQFTDADGNILNLVLAPQSGSYPVNQSYNLGAGTSFTATFIVGSDQAAQDVQGSTGFINLTSLVEQQGAVRQVSGQFAVNLTGGGTATGSFFGQTP